MTPQALNIILLAKVSSITMSLSLAVMSVRLVLSSWALGGIGQREIGNGASRYEELLETTTILLDSRLDSKRASRPAI